MSRSPEAVLKSIVGKLPPGWALALRGGVLDALLEGPAAGIAKAEAEAEAMMDEVDPRTAVALLPDFERVLGPDPCGRDQADLPIEKRQEIAHERWTAMGGQSLPYLIGVAAKLGAVIEIEEFWPTNAGVLQAGMELIGEGEQFVWRVKLAPIGEYLFEAGSSQAGDPLGWIVISDIECTLRRITHEHTTPVFSYTLEEAA